MFRFKGELSFWTKLKHYYLSLDWASNKCIKALTERLNSKFPSFKQHSDGKAISQFGKCGKWKLENYCEHTIHMHDPFGYIWIKGFHLKYVWTTMDNELYSHIQQNTEYTKINNLHRQKMIIATKTFRFRKFSTLSTKRVLLSSWTERFTYIGDQYRTNYQFITFHRKILRTFRLRNEFLFE